MPYSPPFCYLLRDLTYSLVHFSTRAIEKAYFAFILAVIFSILTCFDTRSYLIHLAIEQTIALDQRPGGVVVICSHGDSLGLNSSSCLGRFCTSRSGVKLAIAA
jgi:hypothetical protein